jgi:hypothetical protein
MASWVCKRCETANGTEALVCEVCGGLMLYTHEEVEQLVANRVAAAKAEATATLAATIAAMQPTSTPAPPPVVVTSDCFFPWAVAAFLAFMLILFLFG